MKKYLIILFLSACSHQPYRPLDMANFSADCRYSRVQVDQLTQAIEDYEQRGQDNYPYYQALKNNYWSLKSQCRNLRDS